MWRCSFFLQLGNWKIDMWCSPVRCTSQVGQGQAPLVCADYADNRPFLITSWNTEARRKHGSRRVGARRDRRCKKWLLIRTLHHIPSNLIKEYRKREADRADLVAGNWERQMMSMHHDVQMIKLWLEWIYPCMKCMLKCIVNSRDDGHTTQVHLPRTPSQA